ncbi:hypothetical protein PspLS_09741 [Pyricularia sp. CBS 133598]|nr:hypothetical protein PspLS_09741 [Pyricularia sp. CBS 133598]
MRSLFIVTLVSLAGMTASAPGVAESKNAMEHLQQAAEQSIANLQKEAELQQVEIREQKPAKVVAARTTTPLQLAAKRGQQPRPAMVDRQLLPRAIPNTQQRPPQQQQPTAGSKPKGPAYGGSGSADGDYQPPSSSDGPRVVGMINMEVFSAAAAVAIATYLL